MNGKLWTSVVVLGELPLFSPILFLNLFEPSRTISNLRLKKLSREFGLTTQSSYITKKQFSGYRKPVSTDISFIRWALLSVGQLF
jgi:hypothetical protein